MKALYRRSIFTAASASALTFATILTASAQLRPTPSHGNEFPDRVIALVYDDGPDDRSLELAQYLAQQNVMATFNVVGNLDGNGQTGYLLGKHAQYLDTVSKLGHRLGNHTLNHVPLQNQDHSTIQYQILQNHLNIAQYVTNDFFPFTPPGGNWNLGSNMDSVIGDPLLQRLKGPYVQFPFSANSADWAYAQQGILPEQYAQALFQELQQVRRGIIVNHDGNAYALGSDYALRVAQHLIPQLKAEGYVFVSPSMSFSRTFSHDVFTDPQMMADSSHHGTVRTADVNGDGIADICSRKSNGVYCSIGQRVGALPGISISPKIVFSAETLWANTQLSDTDSLGDPRYALTLQLADVNGDLKADVIVRKAGGLAVGLSTGTSFATPTLWSYLNPNGTRDFSDAEAFWLSNESYYGTFRAADIDGDGLADICARGPNGILCARSTGTSFTKSQYLLTTEFTDAGGWTDHRYAVTMQLGDIDGDGKADLVVRNIAGILIAKSTGSSFSTPLMRSYLNPSGQYDFSDSEGIWQTSGSYYRTFRIADINGDRKSDLCARSPDGIVCAMSNGVHLTKYTLWDSIEFTNANGWTLENYASTLMLADVNNDRRADLIARNGAGIIVNFSP
jgi:peptidoglycan/xylan/chitin deacetylase (PgdA/CDA1 family)